jgi:hypothetical protein
MGPDSIFQDDDEQKKRPQLISRVAPPSMGAPALNVPPIGANQKELNRLTAPGTEDAKPGWQQISNPVGRTFAGIGSTALGILAPRIAGMVPGTTAHHDALVNQQESQLNQDALRQEKNAQSGHLNAETAALQHPPDKPASNEVELFQQDPAQLESFYSSREQHQPDKKQAPIHLSTDQGEFLVDPVTKQATPLTYNGQPLKKAAAPGNFEEQSFNEWHQTHQNGTRMQFEAERANNTRKPEGEQGTWSLQEGDDGKPVLFNSKTGGIRPAPAGLHGKDKKPTADEQRRADLAGNLEENLATLEEIVNRRGDDLFGPIAGRVTGLKASFGSNDPDIGTLETIKHQLGMAQISAHGMRSAQGIEGAATSILNNFKNGPDAVKASINAARNSVQTFKNDVAAAKGGGVTAPSHPANNDPLGIR